MAKHSTGSLGTIEEQIRAVIYGNCIGDALGLLTEFMSKAEAQETYGKGNNLAYTDKIPDMHRMRWKVGDWTDDSDQMILIMQSTVDNRGKAAEAVWRERGCEVAPNGGIMRTSVLGALHFYDLEEVTQNTLEVCKVTHFDPRCQASCVVATTAIALMLQRTKYFNASKEEYDVEGILKEAFENAVQHVFKDLDDKAEKEKELRKYVFHDSKRLKDLHLGAPNSIGYTYKCLGSGCWSLRQKNFEVAMQSLVMEAGDADTNGAIAGALLGCKLGLQALDVKRGESGWLTGLVHKQWLDDIIEKFLRSAISPQHRIMSQAEMDIVFKETRV
ncbi:uncharacterized protein LOC135471129 isoform X2 [Liolophura sinensis]|uniref:uncharacterized protein LOC135471129 isoform X2 n=1 Tax=Liolophura sinensis TaxID=3198878 RepID=UPI00315924C1